MDLSHGAAEAMGFDGAGIRQMHEAALRVLQEIGLGVENEYALNALARAGVRTDSERAYFAPEFVEERLDVVCPERGEPRAREAPTHLTIGVGDMCQYYHNPRNDEIELMATANVIEATKCVETMRDVGIGSYVPGVPRDVPQQLQAIVEYRIGCEFVSGRPTLDTLHPPEALDVLFDMAEAMGTPLESTGIFTVSPLRLSGYEFDVAVQHRERWKRYGVTTYPLVGATAPVRLRAAWVTSIAEALGGAITLHVVGDGKPVRFTVVGGMPEVAWMYWASAQVTRFYFPYAGYSMILSTQAKRPGLQAGAEKAMAGALGAMTGCDDFHYAGVMSFDDIFSPEQMVADCELRDALQQLARGIPCDGPDDWLDVIREGATGGYVDTDTTLDRYRETYWFPELYDRLSWHVFRAENGRTARERAQQQILRRLADYAYRPPDGIEEVRRIFGAAWKRLGGDPASPVLELLANE